MFYVYSISDPLETNPFYIGFSKNPEKRFQQHIIEMKGFTLRNVKPKFPNFIKLGKLRQIMNRGDTPIFEIIFSSEIEKEALDYEIKIIKKYGRICEGNGGILTNLTGGGEGSVRTVNHWSKGLTKDTHPSLMKISKANIGRTPWCKGLSIGKGVSNSFYGKRHTEEFKKRQSETMKIKSSGAGNSNAKSYRFISPSGEEYIVVGRFKHFCREHNIPISAMSKILKTGQTTTVGKAIGWLVFYHQP